MAITIAPFDAARLFDERSHVGLTYFKVDPSTKESLIESVEAISKSTRTQEQVAGMLAVVKVKAADMFTEEEKATLFQDVPESDGTPYVIKIDADNYALLFEALDQLLTQIPEVSETTVSSETVTELETKISELNTQLEENTTNLASKDAKIAELTASIETPANVEELQAEITRLKDELVAKETEIATHADELKSKDEIIETLRGQMVEFYALKHETLVSEAARLGTELNRAFTRGKELEEVRSSLTVRTDESLTDMIADYTLELDSKEELKTDVVETIEDPTIPAELKVMTETLDPKKDLEGTTDALKQSITEEEDSMEIYRIGGHLTEAEIAECRGDQTTE